MLYNSERDMMCCLGFLGEACGLSKEDMDRCMYPLSCAPGKAELYPAALVATPSVACAIAKLNDDERLHSSEHRGDIRMKLWLVSRRAPLQKGERKIWVWRWIVCAMSNEDAIMRVAEYESSDASTPEGRRYNDTYLSGEWSAHENPPLYSIGPVTDSPTPTERKDRT